MKKNQKTKGGLFILAGFACALVVGWVIFPLALYSGKDQPLNFSHARHGPESAGLECIDCHHFHKDGTFSGIPKTSSCMNCHDPESPLSESSEEAKLFGYANQGKEIPWLVYSRQPDCVYFPHVAHVKMANLSCKTCHGDFGTRENPPEYKVNRLTKYSINIWGRSISGYKKSSWDSMKMNDCMACHKQSGKENNNSCFTCHK